MAHTFEELIEKQRAADEAHRRVEGLRAQYGPPAQTGGWSDTQTQTYETAWRAWRDLARDAHTSLTEYAKEQGAALGDVESEVAQAVRQAG
ncbi:hypothetical protein QNN03_18620 [Streptomyces sp. GXMU-J15]|uniref:WXG100 family type VII secretion target n=1 Tax=Streptomyces fuscus TaxID=3048495 RepID=A0ABT7J3V6_9ACTN|nr:MULTISPECIES: hypothetical protein [Streptomyces]MDL2078452.1 hypothetical protein [Streptomyces fuscus]SBT93744.1 hypothetical protein GA0115233_107025 [Streptomyces sp. DI166]